MTAYKYIYYYDQHITCTQATHIYHHIIGIMKNKKFCTSALKSISELFFLKSVYFQSTNRHILQMLANG